MLFENLQFLQWGNIKTHAQYLNSKLILPTMGGGGGGGLGLRLHV